MCLIPISISRRLKKNLRNKICANIHALGCTVFILHKLYQESYSHKNIVISLMFKTGVVLLISLLSSIVIKY